MIYGYIRVSSDKQTTENQKFEIENYCKQYNFPIGKWIEETISSTKKLEDRKFGKLINKLNKGDMIIASELSRIGRNVMQVMGILHVLMQKEVVVHTIKDNYRLGADIQSKVLAFAFSLSAEIERQLISQRTKEALARLKSEGVILGRPEGSKGSYTKLTSRADKVKSMLDKKMSYSAIGRKLNVHRLTVASFAKTL